LTGRHVEIDVAKSLHGTETLGDAPQAQQHRAVSTHVRAPYHLRVSGVTGNRLGHGEAVLTCLLNLVLLAVSGVGGDLLVTTNRWLYLGAQRSSANHSVGDNRRLHLG